MIQRNIKPDSLKYGFSILHANIRFMELVLHISYRLALEVPVWRVSSKDRYIDRQIDISIDKCLDVVFHSFLSLCTYLLYFYKVPKAFEAVTNQKKKEIQDQLKSELSILVDAPTQGSGNTNNGNTARKFFNNIDVVARITGTIFINLFLPKFNYSH